MVNKRSKPLSKENEPSQKTNKGLEIPIPKRGEFMRNLQRVSKTDDSETKRRPKQ
jgi:hypothetical protein